MVSPGTPAVTRFIEADAITYNFVKKRKPELLLEMFGMERCRKLEKRDVALVMCLVVKMHAYYRYVELKKVVKLRQEIWRCALCKKELKGLNVLLLDHIHENIPCQCVVGECNKFLRSPPALIPSHLIHACPSLKLLLVPNNKRDRRSFGSSPRCTPTLFFFCCCCGEGATNNRPSAVGISARHAAPLLASDGGTNASYRSTEGPTNNKVAGSPLSVFAHPFVSLSLALRPPDISVESLAIRLNY
ncbi:hypothetical protein QR680_012162 [Steinernema hermaphroditum]|uniref:Uncharacterized protein n=1 Tax=Steinernema hermaphroditum TaxID=289476 RepID=A0AA39M099_9BILA|nr:hypothetical protein QR680_012162 [Steinernema hermaphroditum]